jgi:hypothetical protein
MRGEAYMRITAVLGLIALSACGGGSDVNNPPEPQQFTLTIDGTGSGSGRVQTSAGTPALDCTLAADAQPAGTCSGSYSEGTVVSLTVTADASSSFDGWSGDASSCSTALSCSITLTQNKTAVAQLSTTALPVEITSSTYYLDPDFGSDGAVIWVVEVRNTSTQLVERARIDFTSHDASGTILTSNFTFVGPIPPGETRAHQSFATYLGTEATVEIQVTEVQFGTDDGNLGAAEIVSSNWRPDPDFGFDGIIIWTVEVMNSTATELESVRVDFVTYDASGKVVAADFTFVGPIPPGERRASQGFADYHGNEATVRFQIASVR